MKKQKENRLLDSLAWTFGWLTIAALALGLLSLLFAIGPYELIVFKSYFRHPLILFLNLAPVVVLTWLLFCLYGKAWPAFLSSSVIVLGFTFGDYYMLKFREDPLMFPDFLNLKEAVSIAAKQSYDLTPDRRQLFGLACVVLGTLFLLLLARGRVRLALRRRTALALVPALMLVPLYLLCADETLYKVKAVNNDAINQWSSTQVYLSRGFVYPFLHSITADRMQKPEGYRASEAQAVLDRYPTADIPEEQRASVVTIQLEAFADFSDCGAEGVDWESAYADYHDILAESCHGRLVDNVFAGGTINTERTFLTGFAQLKNFRGNTNSYARYFADQGYTVLGSHPCYDWFYNRRNVNSYLGIPTYYFFENRYQELSGGGIAKDDVLLPDIFRLYTQAAEDGSSVFSFNVTYQGHGPYDDTENLWGEVYTDGRYSTETCHIVDNYLGSIRDTGHRLRMLLDQFDQREEPVVVVLYGDHRPWLGNNASVYTELGINIDTSTEEGLYNKYSTDYVIWGNTAARETFGEVFTGEGETISPNFLMNQVFDLCGWQGSSYLQWTSAIREQMPVITTIGRFAWEGGFYQEKDLPPEAVSVLNAFRRVQYYWENEFVE